MQVVCPDSRPRGSCRGQPRRGRGSGVGQRRNREVCSESSWSARLGCPTRLRFLLQRRSGRSRPFIPPRLRRAQTGREACLRQLRPDGHGERAAEHPPASTADHSWPVRYPMMIQSNRASRATPMAALNRWRRWPDRRHPCPPHPRFLSVPHDPDLWQTAGAGLPRPLALSRGGRAALRRRRPSALNPFKTAPPSPGIEGRCPPGPTPPQSPSPSPSRRPMLGISCAPQRRGGSARHGGGRRAAYGGPSAPRVVSASGRIRRVRQIRRSGPDRPCPARPGPARQGELAGISPWPA
jgi:hypothetical protein